MKFIKLLNSCLRNDGTIDRLLRLYLKYFNLSFKSFKIFKKKNSKSCILIQSSEIPKNTRKPL